MHLNKNQIIDIIKVLCATTIFTALILWWSQNTWEPINTIDYLNEIDTGTQIISNTGTHNVSTIDSLSTICATKDVLCKKINFIGVFPDGQKAKYINQEDIITSFISEKNATQKPFLPILNTLQINDTEGKRWYATHDKVVINIGDILSDDEFHQISTHELGHIADLGFLQGNSKIKDQTYTEFNKAVFANNDPSLYFYKLSRQNETIRKSDAKKQNFCSIYGMSDPFEDFAECFNLYINHNKVFKYLAQKDKTLWRKFNFLASMFKGTYMNADIGTIANIKDKVQERVRDTTKITIK